MEFLNECPVPDPVSTPTDELVSHYNDLLSTYLQSLAPLKYRTVSFTRTVPWYTPELRLIKSHGRRLERLTKRTGLVVHVEAYSEHLTNYKNALSAARSSYYANVIHISNGNSKVLFSTVNKLLQPPDNFPLCISTDLCNKFLSFFHTKVDAIHQQLLLTSTEHDVLSPTLELVQTGSLTQFLPVNDSTLSEVISKCRSTTCQLDPMPTSLVKSCLPALLPLLLAIINSSLTSGTVPSSLKVAAVTPICKKNRS